MYRAVMQKVAASAWDAFLICDAANKDWLCQKDNYDFPAVLLVLPQQVYLFTTSRHFAALVTMYPEYQMQRGSMPELLQLCRQLGLQSLGCEMTLSIGQHRDIQEALPQCRVTPLPDFVEDLRMVKTPEEVRRLQAATEVSDRGFSQFVRQLKVGMTEAAARNLLQCCLMDCGADGLSFEILLSSGRRCFLPHAASTQKIIEPGDFVLIDFGVRLNGYCSDTTRTLCMGPADALQKRRYQMVLQAQEHAVAQIRAGMTARQGDALARDIIRAAEPEGCYDYGLGHGIGVRVHEKPRMRPDSGLVLQKGMAVSVEPGFYLPDWGGIRIEDIIVIGHGADGGNLVLSQLPKQLLEL